MDQCFKAFSNERNSVGRVIRSEQELNENTFKTEVDLNYNNNNKPKQSKIKTEIQKENNKKLIR